MKFQDRIITQTVTTEFFAHMSDYSPDEIEGVVWAAARRMERTYAVVAMVQKNPRGGKYGMGDMYDIKVIPTMEADMDEVMRGMQRISHWIGTGKLPVGEVPDDDE